MSAPAYLDHAATTAVSEAAIEAMQRAWSAAGNPSSLHSAGRKARAIAEEAREQIAACAGALPGDVVLTGGATEADNLAVIGMFRARRALDSRNRLIIASPTEHHAVLDAIDYLVAHESAVVRWLAVDGDGVVDVEDLHVALADSATSDCRPALVAVMSANNEAGTRQPLARIADACGEHSVPWHCDAVQTAAWELLDFASLGCSTLALSAHKLGGPVGAGALLVRAGVHIEPVTFGGGQERKLRSGTVDAAGAAGFAAAFVERVESLRSGAAERVSRLRAELVSGIRSLDHTAAINGGEDVLPSIVNATFPGCDADALLMLLDERGIACSLGSACTAGVPEASHVLLAMGRSHAEARSSLRFSLGVQSTTADVEAVLSALPSALDRARAAVMSR